MKTNQYWLIENRKVSKNNSNSNFLNCFDKIHNLRFYLKSLKLSLSRPLKINRNLLQLGVIDGRNTIRNFSGNTTFQLILFWKQLTQEKCNGNIDLRVCLYLGADSFGLQLSASLERAFKFPSRRRYTAKHIYSVRLGR